MELESLEYRLSCELRAHEDDARGICICGDVGIATSSRDRTVRFWSPDPEEKHRYVLSKTLVGHSSFVGPLAWISPNESFPDGGIVSGGMDTLVMLWDLKTGQNVLTLKGHQLQVTGLTIDDNGNIISSSVDCTIRRWQAGQAIEFWEAHKAAVQTVIKLPTGELVTGSSDGTLKLWRGRTCLHTFTGHTDTVRGLAVMPALGILSVSHDGSVRLWALSGQVLMEMVGHTSIVYSVDAHSSGLIVSGSEDCSAKIWKDGACIQSMEHPGCVWDTKFLANGDVVTACSDGVVRIWTAHKDRVAKPHELEAYAYQLSNYKCSRKKVGGLKLVDLPGLEALRIPGTSDGQTKVVREGDNGVAYSWNARDQTWDKSGMVKRDSFREPHLFGMRLKDDDGGECMVEAFIPVWDGVIPHMISISMKYRINVLHFIGEVVDGPEDNMNRAVLNGVQYDYVFDVDIGDGEPIRKLPYNRTDNPYTTADKWLLKENLPLSYRQQVVEFILRNSGQSDFALDTSFHDPYTGSSAYIPGQPSNPLGVPTKPTFKHIPKKGMLLFDVAQYDGILKKIIEFNNALSSDSGQNHLALTDVEISRLTAIIKILKDTSHYHCSTFADIDILLLVKLLKSWSLAMMFPAIDILRLIVLHPDGANLLIKHVEDGNDILLETIKRATTSPALPANILTSTRMLTNLFKNSCFHHWLQLHRSEGQMDTAVPLLAERLFPHFERATSRLQWSNLSCAKAQHLCLKLILIHLKLNICDTQILDGLSSCCSSSNKNINLSYSTLILNYAVLLIEKKDQEGQAQVLSAALEIAEDGNLDVDSKFRVLVAVGSLMLEGLVKRIAMDFDVESITRAAKGSTETKIAEVGADIELVIKAT